MGALAPILADAALSTGARTALAVAMLAGICLILFGARVLRPPVAAAAQSGTCGSAWRAATIAPRKPMVM
ncbi:MAG: hypothetical protein ACKOFI_11240, partial [Phycisphaerales bacterium]